ncbi:thiol-disulfide isomerase/thioredoxin [Dysgonomonas sp. PH5-45]|uniref:TlpA disulfide reductase family protein n=1 Tax=unclassified Dysgonomonas TaxID=2630389 RepID=UPI0024756380|nr:MULTISPECIES: TlpA disulfide reductase family protein [unclassified Dysgonomonas]MDH6355023.1 thiol-disulfide isomerase/thioredoxin [Dysgonomonas sp. PH5-45]MDH6387923.1 thiol-disulfide isomerase/thioredoxin [Dysgonomonas sp. PH5-37]
MKKTEGILFFICLLVAQFTVAQSNTFYIDGSIDAIHNGKTIILTYPSDLDFKEDSTTIVDGKFSFTGRESINNFARIATKEENQDLVLSYALVLEKGNITVLLSDSDSLTRVGGTPINDDLQAFLDFRSEHIGKGKKLKPSENFSQAYIDNYYATEKSFFLRNTTNAFGLYILNCLPNSIFDIALQEISPEERNYPQIKSAIAIRKADNEEVARSKSMIGNKITDFYFFDSNKNEKQISEFIGKDNYLFVEFWASWCGPCVADIPNLKKVYEKYKGKGLQIISVSLDSSRKAWEKALEKHGMPWLQFVTLDDELATNIRRKLHFSGIPYSILLDKDGIVLDVDAGSDDLDLFLEGR